MRIDDAATLGERLGLAARTARDAGLLLKRMSDNRASLVVEEKGINDFVSRADRDSEALIRAAVTSQYPADGFVGEETGSSGLSGAPVVWVVDPLDGTSNFLKGVPFWCVSIGLVAGGSIAGGVIYDPLHDELFETDGTRTLLNGDPVHVGNVSDAGHGIVGSNFTPRIGEERFAADLQALLATGLNVRSQGAGALALAYVAAGRLDAYHERHMWPWDAVAGLALVAGAGGSHLPYPAGADLISGGRVLAGNPSLLSLIDDTLESGTPS